MKDGHFRFVAVAGFGLLSILLTALPIFVPMLPGRSLTCWVMAGLCVILAITMLCGRRRP
ncbi:MAG: hypothetical protein INR66_22890 [Gordonia polyisoprenivorans]|nr:hypothetical protein [Gordonia polyisoprenivorans]